jgi:oxygen-independent coproporphyrinogen III oxidase
MIDEALISRYNVQVPRYTSFPTVPFWTSQQHEGQWKHQLLKASGAGKLQDGVNLYIHLPFCESLCTYCGCNKRITKNHSVETTYIDALLKEWDLYVNTIGVDLTIREIHLGGGTPTFFSPENLRILLSGLFERAERHPGFEGSFEGHPNNTTREHLQVLYNLGFTRVSFGVQDMDLKVQTAIHRIQPFENVERVCREARAIGYSSVNFDLIYGLPFQNKDSIRNTFQSVLQLRPERIAFYSYAHVPWTSKSQRAYNESDLPAGSEKRALYELGKQMLLDEGYEDVGMDHFALPGDDLLKAKWLGSLHRNFMGYTTAPSEVLIGLGVSAISDAFFAYRQNEKTLENYYSALENNTFPIAKGIDLTDEDIDIRRHILDITCQLKTKLPPLGSPHKTERSKAYLHQLLEDGLIRISGDEILVTETGSSFLRNIAALFDPSFLQSQGSTARMFSQAI